MDGFVILWWILFAVSWTALIVHFARGIFLNEPAGGRL